MEQYKVIARRWRPKSFKELVGQDAVVQTLSNAIQSNRIAHAYLFVGPRGTGKTSTARLFAMALNCEGGPKIDFDASSPRCQAIFQGQHVDVIEIDGASNNSVEQIRTLREECRYTPAECPFKIYILDEVHMLSTAAFNALLKTLEEPPTHVKFIFATTEIHKVPNTILSRCQHFIFYPLDASIIEKHLQYIAEQEHIEAEPKALAMIAQLAEGGMRDAQSMLDQLRTFGDNKLTEKAVRSMYGLLDDQKLQDLADSIEQNQYQHIVEIVDYIVSNACDTYRVLLALERCFHQRLLKCIQTAENERKFPPLVYTKILDILKNGEDNLQKGLSVRSNFESLLFKAVECTQMTAIETLLQILKEEDSDDPEKKNGAFN